MLIRPSASLPVKTKPGSSAPCGTPAAAAANNASRHDSAIRAKFPEQVQEIWIRDIVNDRELNAGRLAGMRVIPAVTVERGASEFERELVPK